LPDGFGHPDPVIARLDEDMTILLPRPEGDHSSFRHRINGVDEKI
jgi:hypothetical protein